MKKLFTLTALLLFCLMLIQCAGSATKISELRERPDKYNEKEVKVKGEVVQTFAVPFLSQSLVRIDDGTGRIWVKPDGAVPFEGQEISIKGKLKLGLTIANKNLGFIVIENEKKE